MSLEECGRVFTFIWHFSINSVFCRYALLLQVDAGLSFTKKELESSFVFDLRTEERTWYLVAESEEDMNRWVSSICLLCGFNPTDDGKAERGREPKYSLHHFLTLHLKNG